VHAVSVGETLAAAPLLENLLGQYPDHCLVVTTTTPTGSERLRALFGARVFHVYAPWDLPGPVSRFLRRTRPRLLLLMETELWPNMLHLSRRAGCRVLLANARLSARSAAGYRRAGGLTRGMLRQLDTVACQSEEDGRRFLELGLPATALQVVGSVKFDLALDAELVARAERLRSEFGAPQRAVLVAASTHPGEETLILAALRELRASPVPLLRDCLLVLVPRHPERFDEVFELCRAQGWRLVRRSAGTCPGAGDDILLGDSMGELLLLLGTATVAVVGGSWMERGGHNVLEPAAWGVPVVTGPSLFNFAQSARLLIAAGALVRLESGAELAPCLQALLADPRRREAMGVAGRQVLAENRGATDRLLALVAGLLAQP
jgi:3-deoxy-D-manno-octulosonic-acid transferase